jgi:poly(A) polymerase
MTAAVEAISEAFRATASAGYFVGGCVRDCLLGRPVKDIDLLVDGDPWPFARRLARLISGSAFWLREEEGVARVVAPRSGGPFVDIAGLAVPVEADLLARDLTINAMAIEVRHGLRAGAPVIDPAGGQADLQRRSIRFARPDAVERDPLRALRAIRLRRQLGFRLAARAAGQIRSGAALLARVSPERVRDEVFLMLERETAARAVDDLIRYGLWPTIFPGIPGAPVGECAFTPAEAVRRLERILRAAERLLRGRVAADYLAEEITAPRSRRALVRWTGMLLPFWMPAGKSNRSVQGGSRSDAEKDWRRARQRAVEGVCDDLRLSVKERRLVARAIVLVPETSALLENWPPSGRELLRWSRAAGDASVEAALLAGIETGWSSALRQLVDGAVVDAEAPRQPLLTGHEIMDLLGLRPGPRVGELLAAVEEARADGLVSTPGAAREWLVQHEKGSL